MIASRLAGKWSFMMPMPPDHIADGFLCEGPVRRVLINGVLGPAKTDATPPSEDEERDRLREIARSCFTVIDGGRPGEGTE